KIINNVSSTCIEDTQTIFDYSKELSDFALLLAPYYFAKPKLEGVKAFFETKPMTELGRISYSLYLVHFPILLVLAPHLVVPGWPWLSLLAILLGVVTTSLIVGDLAWRVVERPSMHLGRWLAKRIP
ncbi:MAG: acyltransferase family protein, partial [bacterium]